MGVVEALPTINHDAEFKAIFKALHALREGDFSVRLPSDWPEPAALVAGEFNDFAARLARMGHEMRGIERDMTSRLGGAKRLDPEDLSGAWLDWSGTINSFAERAERIDTNTRATLAALNSLRKGNAQASLPDDWTGSVSYTHLTLPTNREV